MHGQCPIDLGNLKKTFIQYEWLLNSLTIERSSSAPQIFDAISSTATIMDTADERLVRTVA